ncbi:MAG: family 10 glycosylhydrolase [Candidatus Cloacimonetes bacterium]|nr:family 10 glycosylhydrolase [Candidatus Cloacimonadota bacterium]
MKRYLLILLLSTIFSLSAEIRSLWVLPWNITSPSQIDQVIEDAIAANQTELLVEVRYRSDALYRPNRKGDRFFNPEPRSYILKDPSFDPLEYTIYAAKNKNLKVQAWVIVFNATPTAREYVAINHIYNNHPEWITHDKDGRQMRSSEQFGYFIDPGIPEVQEYLLDVFSDIVYGYPELDGLHLDYIRYPSSAWGYHPISVNRYQESIREGELLSWNQWRTQQVTEFVEKCYQQIKSINPKMLLTAAVFSNINDARTAYAQDWYDWLNKGIIDRIYPMAYHLDYDNFRNQLASMKNEQKDDKLVIGLRAWDAKGKSLMPLDSPSYNISHINKRIALIREGGFAGIALFSYDGIIKKQALTSLTNLAFPALEQIPEPTVEELAEIPLSPDASVSIVAGSYVIQLSVPSEGRWNIEILNLFNDVLHDKQRVFNTGLNELYWSGETKEGTKIPPGTYILKVYREEAPISYYVPLHLGEL